MPPRRRTEHRLASPSVFIAALYCLLLAAAPRAAQAQAFSFGLRFDLTTAANPRGAIGDVNGDGKPDLITTSGSANSISVLLGNGVGGFSPKSDVVIPGSGPTSMALGDLNGDGIPDVAMAGSSLTLSLGNGAGGFGATSYSSTGPSAREVKVADMTGDGRLDVVVIGDITGFVAIHPGNGAGQVGPYKIYFVPSTTQSGAIGDLNGDGLPDMCIMAPSVMFCALVSNGTGGYLRTDYPVAAGTAKIAIGDVNGDGKLDAVTTNATAATVSVYPGNGTGALGAKTDYAAVANVRSVEIADMNGDGLADLAITTSTSAPYLVGVMLGNGAGAFAAPTTTTTVSLPSVVSVGDVNGDGRPDLVVTGSGSIAAVHLNGTGGAFRARTDVAVGSTPRGIAMGDLNADSRPDLAVSNAGSNSVSVLLANDAGGFQRTDVAVQTAPVGVAIGDVSDDGIADMVVANSQSATISECRGTGLGAFGLRLDWPAGAGPVSVVLADLKAAGWLDVAVANNIASTMSVFPNILGSVLPKTDYTTGTNPACVAVGDLNADDRPDLVVSNGSSNTASVFLGTGGGIFGAKTDFTTGATPLGIALGDVNGDGKLDLAVTNGGANTVSVLLGNGTGGFGAKVDFPTGVTPSAVTIGDVNGDGRLDLAVANVSTAAVSLLLGNGAGSFGPAASVTTAAGAEALAMGDLNGDGRLDLAVAARTTNQVSVLLGLVPTRTTLSVSASSIIAGGPMALSASVSVPAPGTGTPADSVRFFDGNTLLGTAPVIGGAAWLAILAPYLGDRAITAVYKGDGKFLGSISNVARTRVVATAAALITGIADVAADQGGQARLSFARSPYDYLGSGTPITGYQVYRRAIVAGPQSAWPAADAGARRADPTAAQLAGWDFVLTIPASTDDAYQAVVPTLADSNASGLHRAVLFVRAVTATPGIFYDSPADSGYTVDNLLPAAPSALTAVYAAGATHLHWARNLENDFASYRVYRGASAGFSPGAGNLVASLADTGYADTGPPGSYYKLCAVDANDNQSNFALVGPGATTGVPQTGTATFALDRVRPNPAPASRITVTFTLPTGAPAQLEVFDVRGARVASQDVGDRGAGRHTVPLSAARLAPGVYLVRLTQGAASMTQRMTVVER